MEKSNIASFGPSDFSSKQHFEDKFRELIDLSPSKFNEWLSSVKIEETKPTNTPKRKFHKMEATPHDSTQIGKSFLYDFDLFKIEDQIILGCIIENRYLLYSIDKEQEKMSILKEEEISLIENGKESPETEIFYRIKFVELFKSLQDGDSDLVIALSGKSGIIYLINIDKDFTIEYLLGHVTEVYDIIIPNKIDALWKNLLMSCSKDRSIILWNIYTSILFLRKPQIIEQKIIYFREENQLPTDPVALCWHPKNLMFAVSYFDGSITLWNIEKNLKEKIHNSHNFSDKPTKWRTLEVRKAWLYTRDIHKYTCDGIHFIGDFLLSKDTHGVIKMTAIFQVHRDNNIGIVAIKEISYKYYEPIWFLQFSFDPVKNLLYLGNDNGEIYFWRIEGREIIEVSSLVLPSRKVIRKVEFNVDFNIILAVTDDGKIWRYKLREKDMNIMIS